MSPGGYIYISVSRGLIKVHIGQDKQQGLHQVSACELPAVLCITLSSSLAPIGPLKQCVVHPNCRRVSPQHPRERKLCNGAKNITKKKKRGRRPVQNEKPLPDEVNMIKNTPPPPPPPHVHVHTRKFDSALHNAKVKKNHNVNEKKVHPRTHPDSTGENSSFQLPHPSVTTFALLLFLNCPKGGLIAQQYQQKCNNNTSMASTKLPKPFQQRNSEGVR